MKSKRLNTLEIVLDAVISVLVSKGVITRNEVQEEILNPGHTTSAGRKTTEKGN